ncbi:hypothetical protein BDB01DRAFT_700698, partial [Pilobolus umbonatus]
YFYITEQSKKSKEIAYFRQDVFMQSSQSYFHMLMEDHYLSEIHSDQLSRLSLGVANVRLIPKKGGFRMITNMHTTRKYVRMQITIAIRHRKLFNMDCRLYFVKVDVKDCFDNMDQERLL